MNNKGKKSFQWEIWNQCFRGYDKSNSHCTFCYLEQYNRNTSTERKLNSILDFNKTLDTLDFNIYNNISIIGGDMWGGECDDVKDQYYSTIRRIIDFYKEEKIESVWLTATLIGPSKHLFNLLPELNQPSNPLDGASGIWICTSWDKRGRFHSEGEEEQWHQNMLKIKEIAPNVKINTTMVLTEDWCQAFNEDKLGLHFNTLKDYEKLYQSSLFFKQTGALAFKCNDEEKMRNDPEALLEWWMHVKQETESKIGHQFYTKRNTLIKTMNKFCREYPTDYNRLFNIQFRADELHRNLNDIEHDKEFTRGKHGLITEEFIPESKSTEDSIPNPICKLHAIAYSPYIDSHKCAVCDRNDIMEAQGV